MGSPTAQGLPGNGCRHGTFPRQELRLGILRLLEQSSNLVLSEGTIYPILNRLRQDGIVNSTWVESELGHPRRYYVLTPKGRERAVDMAKTWLELASGLERLARPVMANGGNNHDGNH